MDKADPLPASPPDPVEAPPADSPDGPQSKTQTFLCGPEASPKAFTQLLRGPRAPEPETAPGPPQPADPPEAQRMLAAAARDPNASNAVFERLLFCKAKVLSNSDRAAQPKQQAKLRKSFWLFPFPDRDLDQDEKEEADLLTTFGFNHSVGPRLSAKKLGPFEFVYEFFASFRQEQLNFFGFVLNSHKQQAAYENCYNASGLRYFFGCQFLDFEYQSKQDRRTPLDFGLEVGQSLLLVESKYPFRSCFEAVLKLVFNVVRVKRLELYAFHYNGNERDVANLEHLKKYDCSSVPKVAPPHQILTSFAAPILAALRSQNFAAGVRLTDSCLNQTLAFSPKPVLADYYESLESTPG